MVSSLGFVIQWSILYLTLNFFPSAQKIWLEFIVAFVTESVFTVVFVVESLVNFILLFSECSCFISAWMNKVFCMDVSKSNDQLYCFHNLTTVSLSLDRPSCCQEREALKLVWCCSFIPVEWQKVLAGLHFLSSKCGVESGVYFCNTGESQTQLAALGEAQLKELPY